MLREPKPVLDQIGIDTLTFIASNEATTLRSCAPKPSMQSSSRVGHHRLGEPARVAAPVDRRGAERFGFGREKAEAVDGDRCPA
jgi:hypothetical protein